MTTHAIKISPLTPATREDITDRIDAVGDHAHTVTVAIVKAIGPRDRVAEQDGAAAVQTIEIRTEDLAAAHSDVQDADLYTIFIRLGEDLTRSQIERALTAIAADGCLEAAFEDVAKAGQHRAEVRADAVQHVQDRAAAIIAAAGRDNETPALAPGWVRHRVHERGSMAFRLDMHLWPVGDLPGLARWLDGHAMIALAWDPADATRAVMSRPEDYIRELAASGERPPLDRPTVAAAAWNAGYHNVRAIAGALDANRTTIYADLRAAGLERE